jgi:hypothetical protein
MIDVEAKSYKSFKRNWYLTSNKFILALSENGNILITEITVSGTTRKLLDSYQVVVTASCVTDSEVGVGA